MSCRKCEKPRPIILPQLRSRVKGRKSWSGWSGRWLSDLPRLSGLRKELKHGLHVRPLSFCLLSESMFLSFSLGAEPLLLSLHYVSLLLHFFPLLLKLKLHHFDKLFHGSEWLPLTIARPRSVQKNRVRILVASKTLLCFSLTEFKNSEHLAQNPLYFIRRR